MQASDPWHDREPQHPHWPKGVKTLSLDQADSLGVDRNNNLYFDGRPLAYGLKLSKWEKGFAILAAVATAVSALMSVLTFFRGCPA